MNHLEKALARFAPEDRLLMRAVFVRIRADDLLHLDVRKLKGYRNLYRVRLGECRIIFERTDAGENEIVVLTRRNENTYRDL